MSTARPVTTTPTTVNPAGPITTTPTTVNPARPVTTTPTTVNPARPVTTTPTTVNPAGPVTTTPTTVNLARPINTTTTTISQARPVTNSTTAQPSAALRARLANPSPPWPSNSQQQITCKEHKDFDESCVNCLRCCSFKKMMDLQKLLTNIFHLSEIIKKEENLINGAKARIKKHRTIINEHKNTIKEVQLSQQKIAAQIDAFASSQIEDEDDKEEQDTATE